MIASFEPGLPGTGPLPVHLHTGRPTPWSEGVVVRFTPRSGDPWIANLQAGWGYAKCITDWPEARAVVVIANGAVYFVPPDQPKAWRFIDPSGIACTLALSHQLALISTYTDVVAISADGTVKWRRTVAIDGVEITAVEDRLIYGIGAIDPTDEWYSFILDVETGDDAGRIERLDMQ